MPLEFPPQFPQAYRLPVIAAEASARATLLQKLKAIDWSWAPSRGNYINRETIRDPAVDYLCVVAGEFAKQACLAVRAKHYPATLLDAAVEAFVALAQYHFIQMDHEKIREAWSDYSRLTDDTTATVMQAEWHDLYLAEIPRVIEAITPQAPTSESIAADRRVQQRSEARRRIVEPLLVLKAFSASRWADEAGVDPSVALDYLNGISTPRPRNREALAEALGVKAPDLPE